MPVVVDRNLRRQKVLYNSTNTSTPLMYNFSDLGDRVFPDVDAGDTLITIYPPTSTTALVSAANATTTITTYDASMTYAVDTTTTASWPVDTGYRADLTFTIGTTSYYRTLVFDVVKFIMHTGVTFKQLVAIDDGIQGMEHHADGEFVELIEACYNLLQLRIETKLIEDNRLVDSMFLDPSKVGLPHAMLCLEQIWANKGDMDRRDYYKEKFSEIWTAVLGGVNFDKDQDGQEDGSFGGVQLVRLIT